MIYASGPETLHKPRILCLHGGGVSAKIFRLQARCLVASLAPYFRLVFVDGPFPSEMHDDLKPVYGQMGPCHRWAAWLPHHVQNSNSDTVVVDRIEDSLQAAIKADPGTGEWVGLLGFSQGAKLAISILLENQLRQQQREVSSGEEGVFFAGVHWKFGIIMAGRAPPYSLSERTKDSPYFDPPGKIPPPAATTRHTVANLDFPHKLTTPTLHVHGIRDAGLPFHRQLLRDYVASDRAVLVEWDGRHRLPIRTADVEAVTGGILRVAGVYTSTNLTC